MRTTQEIADLIEELVKSKKTTIKQMLLDCGVNRNVVTALKTGQMPSADKLVKIANYLNVSAEYLTGVSDDPESLNERNAPVTIEGAKRVYNALIENGIVKPDEKLNEKQIEVLIELFKINKDFIRFKLDKLDE